MGSADPGGVLDGCAEVKPPSGGTSGGGGSPGNFSMEEPATRTVRLLGPWDLGERLDRLDVAVTLTISSGGASFF